MAGLLFFALALIVSALALARLSAHEERRMIRDVGLLGIDLFSVIIAIFVGVSLLYKELALETVYAILAKPIARWELVLGKWLGILAILSAQIAVMGAVLAATLVVGAGRGALDASLLSSVWLVLMNVTIVSSVAMLFSAFTSPFLSGLFCLGVFVVGRLVPDLRRLAERAGGTAGRLIAGVASVLPDLHLFTPPSSFLGAAHAPEPSARPGELAVSAFGSPVSWPVGFEYLGAVTAYALGYSALVLGLAMLIFRRRDFV